MGAWRGKAKRLITPAVLLVLPFVAGCSPQARSPHIVRWDAGYSRHNLLEGFEGWTDTTEDILLWRLSLEPYWRILEELCKKHETADVLLIAELMPYEDASEYWACLLVREGDDYWCYATGFPVAAPSDTKEGLAQVAYGVWGKLQNERTARAFFRLFEGEDVWASDSLRVVPFDGQFTHPRAWLINAYKREGERFCQMAIDRPMLDTAVINGRKGIAETRKAGEPDPMASWGNWSHGGIRKEQVADLYEASYPIRLVINGLLRIVHEEYPKEVTH